MASRPETLYLRIPEDVQQRLKEWARATGLKLTDLSCEFLKAGLDNPPATLRKVRDQQRQLTAAGLAELPVELGS